MEVVVFEMVNGEISIILIISAVSSYIDGVGVTCVGRTMIMVEVQQL